MTLIIALVALFVGFGLGALMMAWAVAAKRADERAAEELYSSGGTDSDDDQTERTA